MDASDQHTADASILRLADQLNQEIAKARAAIREERARLFDQLAFERSEMETEYRHKLEAVEERERALDEERQPMFFLALS